MDEQEDTNADELDLDTAEDEVADTKATDTDEQETDSEDEQEQDTLELEDEPVKESPEKGKAKQAKEKLVNDWAKKVKSDAKSLDDIPKDQAWLRPLVEAKLGDDAKPTKEVLKELLQEEKAADKFQSLKETVQDMGLEPEKKSVLEAKFKSFRVKGLSKLDALEAAMEIAGVNPDEAALDAKRNAARLRVPGSYKKGKVDPTAVHDNAGYGELAKNVPEKERRAYLKSLLD